MKKDSLLLSIILVFGSFFLIVWFINPNYILTIKDKAIVFLQDLYILTKNYIYTFGR